MKFATPDITDKRIIYAAEKLRGDGFTQTDSTDFADFILLGVNPDKRFLSLNKPTYAGNIATNGNPLLYDYMQCETLAVYNAYLTAEAAVALAVTQSNITLINARVLITGYGRIGKALHRFLSNYTNSITICARNPVQLTLAAACGAYTAALDGLTSHLSQDFIFNTVPHPLFDYATLSAIGKETELMDLASFPGGVDAHAARVLQTKLTVARGLPGKYAPKSAGYAVAEAVEGLLREVNT